MEKLMMLYTTATAGEKTFGMLPLHDSCPFNEAIYMPKLEALAVLGKSTRDTFTMIERLDENGEPATVLVKENKEHKKIQKQQRVQVQSPWEYFITEKSEIRDFIRQNAINADSFNFEEYITNIEVVNTI